MKSTRLIIGLSLAVAVLGGCTSDLGDETLTVALAYGPSSNWGPTNASGTALVIPDTGQVDISVKDLPALTDERYEGWLAGGGETPISTGRFNTDMDGKGSSSLALGDIRDASYERVIITVEPEPDPTPKPDPRHSIEGELE